MRLFAGTPWDQPPRCDRCGALEADCKCPPVVVSPLVLVPPEQQTARLAIENRKRGKSVTVVRGLPALNNDLPSLLAQMKTTCGAGGTIKDDSIEIQGQHLDRIRTLLSTIGYKVKG